MNDKMFPRRFTEALRPGTYLRIVVEGDVGAGDEIRVVERPDHDLTVRHVFRIYTHDRHEADRLLAVPQMSESWKSWASSFLQKTKGRSLRANRVAASQYLSRRYQAECALADTESILIVPAYPLH